MAEEGKLACPDCRTEWSVVEAHLCPVTCRAKIGPLGPEVVRCPCCRESFETRQGHVCLRMIRLFEPAQ